VLVGTNVDTAMTAIVDEAAILLKLQSQFGDLDLTNLLNEDEAKTKDGYSSEESSLAEPTAEELLAWQEAQFKKGQQEIDTKKRLKMTPLQRRRDLKKVSSNIDADEEEWEQVPALPDLGGTTSAFFPSSDEKGNELLGVHPMLQQLVQGDPDILGTKWSRLYSSSEGDGLSFHNLLNTIKGYQGPTVMLIGTIPSVSRSLTTTQNSEKTTIKRTTIGYYTTSGWEESADFFGNSDCFLFSFQESDNKLNFFHPIDSKDADKKNYMYCHPSSLKVTNRRSKTPVQGNVTDGSVHGIGVGGTPSQPRLHLTESLEECRAMEHCKLFEGGDLLMGAGTESLNYFDVDCLEVWGAGGDEWIRESIEARQKGRDIKEAHLQRARKVDKKQFLDDFRMGRIAMNGSANPALFGHMQYTTGRTEL
jgi:hypothetical protein